MEEKGGKRKRKKLILRRGPAHFFGKSHEINFYLTMNYISVVVFTYIPPMNVKRVL